MILRGISNTIRQDLCLSFHRKIWYIFKFLCFSQFVGMLIDSIFSLNFNLYFKNDNEDHLLSHKWGTKMHKIGFHKSFLNFVVDLSF